MGGIYSHNYNKLNKKLTCFKQKYQKSKNIAEYPLHQLTCLGRLEIQITFLNLDISVRILTQGH